MSSVCNLARLDFGALHAELEQRNMGLLGFSPLHGGMLTDQHEHHPTDSDDRRSGETVSYTHLTLPTILLV